MALPEELQHLLVAGLGGVVGDEHDLGVAGASAADLLVGGVRGGAARVADRGRVDAVGFPEDLLGAPEAAHAEDRRADTLGEGRLQGGAEHGMAVGDGDLALAARQRGGGIDQRCLVTAKQSHALRLAGASRPAHAACGAPTGVASSAAGGRSRPCSSPRVRASAARARTRRCRARSRAVVVVEAFVLRVHRLPQRVALLALGHARAHRGCAWRRSRSRRRGWP